MHMARSLLVRYAQKELTLESSLSKDSPIAQFLLAEDASMRYLCMVGTYF